MKKKVYGSVYSACMECDLKEKECEKMADKICTGLKKHLKGKKQIVPVLAVGNAGG